MTGFVNSNDELAETTTIIRYLTKLLHGSRIEYVFGKLGAYDM